MNVLILGAGSDMALALASKFAQAEGASLTLASRDMELLAKRAKDLELRYQVRAKAAFFEATDYASHAAFYATLEEKPDVVVLAFGVLPDEDACRKDFAKLLKSFEINALGAISILEIVAADFEAKGRGSILAFSSPAAERGRQSNYVYGAAKAALHVYLSGLRNRLCRSGVKVMTIVPGFVRTKMTEHMKLPGKLTASPEEVAETVYKGFKRGANVVYAKPIWRYIMLIIKHIPECVFKRLGL